MRVLVYPADVHGCGHHRIIWPAEVLKSDGHDVTVVLPKERALKLVVDRDDVVRDVKLDQEADVVVFQRPTHAYLRQAVSLLRKSGIATVVDVDDDLTTIHPNNVAFSRLHPRNYGKSIDGKRHLHSWSHLSDACRDATLVTASTPTLLERYARHGRGVTLHNYLAAHYYDLPRVDSDVIGWPASLHNHPNDPAILGNAMSRIMGQGATFRVFGEAGGVAREFGLTEHPLTTGAIPLLDWPTQVAALGIGIAPLADTAFNAAKSWLKPLELAACGVPWVGSPRVEYRRLHELGCGILVDRPKDWYKTLRSLRGSALLRADASESGRTVADQLRLDKHAWRWLEAWNEALRLQRS